MVDGSVGVCVSWAPCSTCTPHLTRLNDSSPFFLHTQLSWLLLLQCSLTEWVTQLLLPSQVAKGMVAPPIVEAMCSVTGISGKGRDQCSWVSGLCACTCVCVWGQVLLESRLAWSWCLSGRIHQDAPLPSTLHFSLSSFSQPVGGITLHHFLPAREAGPAVPTNNFSH